MTRPRLWENDSNLHYFLDSFLFLSLSLSHAVCPRGKKTTNKGAAEEAKCEGCKVFTQSGAPEVNCPAGKFHGSKPCTIDECVLCVPGFYCSGGSHIKACPAGVTSDERGAKTISDCDKTKCPGGHYCEEGTTSEAEYKSFDTVPKPRLDLAIQRNMTVRKPRRCAAGYLCGEGLSSIEQSDRCPQGQYCPEGTGKDPCVGCLQVASLCPRGFCCNNESPKEDCIICGNAAAGSGDEWFCPEGSSQPSLVTAGHCAIGDPGTVTGDDQRNAYAQVPCGMTATAPDLQTIVHMLQSVSPFNFQSSTSIEFTNVANLSAADDRDKSTIEFKIRGKVGTGTCADDGPETCGGIVQIPASSRTSTSTGIITVGKNDSAQVTLESVEHNSLAWGRDGGTWEGNVTVEWYVLQSGNGAALRQQITSTYTIELPAFLEVSARVPALVLPESLTEGADAGTVLERNDELGIYAVGNKKISWSLGLDAGKCNENHVMRTQYLADTQQTQQTDPLLASSVVAPWLRIEMVKRRGTKIPGDGVAKRVSLIFNATTFLGTPNGGDGGIALASACDSTVSQGSSVAFCACLNVSVREDRAVDSGNSDNITASTAVGEIFLVRVPIKFKVSFKCKAGDTSISGRTRKIFVVSLILTLR